MLQENHNLWAPWRMAYIRSLAPGTQPEESGRCFLCAAAEATVTPGSDAARERLVLHRDDFGVILLNRFPYTNGHLLIAPLEHIAELSDLTREQRGGLMELTDHACRILRAAVNPQGMNVGVNLGRCAGAGLPGHVHVHVVPRWNGDTNFMAVVGDVRVVPEALDKSYDILAAAHATL